MVSDHRISHNIQVSPEHYYAAEYDSKKRWISYWHQINEVVLLQPETILEIGIGNGLVSDYLKQRGWNVTTIDVDDRLSPDHVGSVLDLPFQDQMFDTVACFEVLEHLPYESFETALAEIYRVSSSNAVLSLPNSGRAYRLEVQIPKVEDFKWLIPLPRLRKPVHEFDGQHYWEIGKANYELKRVVDSIESSGFELLKTYRVFEHPYHRFFILTKQ